MGHPPPSQSRRKDNKHIILQKRCFEEVGLGGAFCCFLERWSQPLYFGSMMQQLCDQFWNEVLFEIRTLQTPICMNFSGSQCWRRLLLQYLLQRLSPACLQVGKAVRLQTTNWPSCFLSSQGSLLGRVLPVESSGACH